MRPRCRNMQSVKNHKKELAMPKILLIPIVALSVLAGCASVPMESAEKSDMAKKFSPPSNGHAGVYVYRSGSFGGL